MRIFIAAMLIITGIIHLLPLSGVLGAPWLTRLYGLSFDEPNLEILMRHRAVPYGLLGLFFLYAAFRIDLQRIAFVAAFLSAGSFVWIAWSVGGYNALIQRVVIADSVAVGCVAAAIFAKVFLAKQV